MAHKIPNNTHKKKTRINKPDNFPLFLFFLFFYFWHITEKIKKKHERRWDFLDFISLLKLPFVQIYFRFVMDFYFIFVGWYLFYLLFAFLFWFVLVLDGVKLYDGGKLLYSLFMLNCFLGEKILGFFFFSFYIWFSGSGDKYIQKHKYITVEARERCANRHYLFVLLFEISMLVEF